MKTLDEAIKSTNQLVIYGAGHIGDLLYAYISMMKCDGKIVSFAVTKVTLPSKKHGLPVTAIKDAYHRWPYATVIIAVHEKSAYELLNNAREVGYESPVCLQSQDLLDALYEKLYVFPIKRNKVFFMNYYGCGYGCNPKYIAEEIIRNGGDYELVWGIDDNNYSFPEKIKTVRIGTYEYYKELATSGIWIDNVRKTADVKKRKGQYYIQTWHGSAPFKKVEGDLIGKASALTIEFGKRDSELADLFISGSRFYSSLYKRAFWYEGEILESGLPRQDIFWNQEKARAKVFSKYGISQDEFVVLYAPTFRDDGRTESFDINIKMLMDAIKTRFGRRCTLFIGKHPINRDIIYGFDSKDYVDVSRYDDFEEILAASDVLITDYSGCVYDFSFTGRPVFLYQPDFDEMLQDRGFYVAPEHMPYPSAHDMEDLVSRITLFNEQKYKQDLNTFMKKFGNFDDGKASERVYRKVFLNERH